MNCTEAQVLLAAHRELKNSDFDTTELDVHLEHCAACRQVLAYSTIVGEQVRALPSIEPSPNMYTSLMGKLAIEHAKHLQQEGSNALPPPAFLKPYIQEHLHSRKKTSPLAAFSTADTGPIPVLPALRKKHRRSYMGQFALIGLAAVFLLTFMVGGITSLLLLANNHIGTGPELTVVHPTDIVGITYNTTTPYPHVVSAVADSTSIYYTAYGDVSSNGWMLEQLHRNTQISTPLLSTPSLSPLIMLGYNNGWLVWLQFDAPQTTTQDTTLHHPLHTLFRAWSVHYMYVGATLNSSNSAITPDVPMQLLSGTFDQATVPDWIHTPVQGIWFVQNTLLIATIDEGGTSHLMRYQLDTKNNYPVTEIAKASPGHIFTSPTANSDGTQIFWADEWRTSDGNLHSNIWTRQVTVGPMVTHGRLTERPVVTQQLYLQDGMSFRPVVVNESLIFLSTSTNTGVTPTTTGTSTSTNTGTGSPTASASPATTASATATPNTNNTPGVSWADTSIYTAPLDTTIHGNILLLPLNGDPFASPTQINNLGLASSLQVGTDFVFWQSDDGSYGMYDVPAKTDITVGTVLDGAQFLAISGNSAVWTVNTPANKPNVNGSVATLMAFNWPRR